VLHGAISAYHAHTCIRFRPALENDVDKVHIMGGDSCSSYVGRQGGVQNLYLDTICRKVSNHLVSRQPLIWLLLSDISRLPCTCVEKSLSMGFGALTGLH